MELTQKTSDVHILRLSLNWKSIATFHNHALGLLPQFSPPDPQENAHSPRQTENDPQETDRDDCSALIRKTRGATKKQTEVFGRVSQLGTPESIESPHRLLSSWAQFPTRKCNRELLVIHEEVGIRCILSDPVTQSGLVHRSEQFFAHKGTNRTEETNEIVHGI